VNPFKSLLLLPAKFFIYLSSIDILLTLILLAAPGVAVAVIPVTINYQGQLNSAGGVPVTATVSITFSLYDVAVGGVPLWTSTRSVAVSMGLFSEELGSVTPFGPLAFDVPYWLGVKVGTDAEMTPRKPFTSTPYAFRAANAGLLDGNHAGTFATAADYASLLASVASLQAQLVKIQLNTGLSTNRLNDTGITRWGDAVSNSLPATQAAFPVQDADVGRDADPALNSNSDGRAGFSFTKLDAAGAPLGNQAAVYATTPWSCVKDNVTGMMWEVKTTAGAGGVRDPNYSYTWFNSTGVNDGGAPGVENGGVCVDPVSCDTEKYVATVNAAGLCGHKDWRMPDKEALRSIVDYSGPAYGQCIDTGYFPNTKVNQGYWSASTNATNSAVARSVEFMAGSSGIPVARGTGLYVRLVRGGL